MESVLEETLVEGQERGELDDALDAKAIASLLLATIVGITVLAKIDGSAARTNALHRALAQLVAALAFLSRGATWRDGQVDG